ncbi:MAG TPA: acyl-CoA dehydrogenase family protein [Stellaceae bacterium]|nr:acyl-CoA dehydrogenase family protein [Stellaceae bacterium]
MSRALGRMELPSLAHERRKNVRRHLARGLADQFAACAAEHDRNGSFPFENFTRLHEAGLLALTVSKEHGGSGAGLGEAAAIVRIIAAAEASTALVLAMQYLQHAAAARTRRWPAALRECVARDAVARGTLINAVRVEPELGTPARGGLPKTIARRVAGGWRISGHKIYCTGAPALGWFSVWARTEDEAPQIGFWLVPAEAAGIRIVETWDQLGLRASGSHDAIFDDVFVTDEHAADIRPIADWAEPDPVAAAWNTLILAALYLGIADAARDWLLGHLHRRVPGNLGTPLASLPRVEEAVGEIEALLQTGDSVLSAALAAVDNGAMPDIAAAGLVKFTVTNNAVHAVERALSLVGNAGLARVNPLERHYRDVLCGRIHTPQDDSILIAAGRAALARHLQENPS